MEFAPYRYKNKNFKVMTPRQATSSGYVWICGVYFSDEKRYFHNALDDLFDCDIVLVSHEGGSSIFRNKNECLFSEAQIKNLKRSNAL